jgi:hypothetical protein
MDAQANTTTHTDTRKLADSSRLHEEWHGDGFLSRTTFLEIANAMGVDESHQMLKLFDLAIGRQ